MEIGDFAVMTLLIMMTPVISSAVSSPFAVRTNSVRPIVPPPPATFLN